LFRIGEPTSVAWYAEGRPATRKEVLVSIDSGLPLLQEHCADAFELEALALAHARAMLLLPTA
jgi:hypothetical protein